MPQMAPLWWTSMLFMFSLLLCINLIINYFNFPYSYKTHLYSQKKKLTQNNWKW